MNFFSGSSYADKLKEDIQNITEKINETNQLITEFKECMLILRNKMATDIEAISPKYDNCTINIHCTLNNLKLLLADKKIMLKRELKSELSGFGKYCNLNYNR